MKLEIEQFDAWKIFNEKGQCYMRVLANLPDKGPTHIWYAATRSGWELIPDSLDEQMEAAFNQQQKGTLQ